MTRDDLKGILVPVYAGLGENDQMVPESLAQDLDTWANESSVDITLEIYSKSKHGFAARPEAKDSHEKEQYERAFSQAVSFFTKHE